MGGVNHFHRGGMGHYQSNNVSGGGHSGGFSGGNYGQEDLRMPKRGKDSFQNRNQGNRKAKIHKPNSQTNSSKVQSNNHTFTRSIERNNILSQDDYIYTKKFSGTQDKASGETKPPKAKIVGLGT